MKSYYFKLFLLLAVLASVPHLAGCEKPVVPANERLTSDIARWEIELAKVQEKAKEDRTNASHHNAEAELIRSRIARLKAKLRPPH